MIRVVLTHAVLLTAAVVGTMLLANLYGEMAAEILAPVVEALGNAHR